MRFGEVALDLRPLLRRLGQQVDMHLVGAELRALMAEMGKLQASGEQEVRDVLHLRALAQDASRVASDIAFYLDQKERVQRFNERTTEALDQADRNFLAGIIYYKMNSVEF